MPKYMFTGSYTPEGRNGLLKEGGTARAEAVDALVAGLGGRVESVYFRFGRDDFVIIAEMPDNASCASASLIAASSGAIEPQVVPLLTPEEIDKASQASVDFRPPGA